MINCLFVYSLAGGTKISASCFVFTLGVEGSFSGVNMEMRRTKRMIPKRIKMPV